MIHPLQRLAGLLIASLALLVGWSYAPDRPVQALVARWAPPPSDFIELDGQLVHLRDEGRRDDPLPIVLLHGTGASLHTWQGWSATLRSRHRVISVDLPGFGLTGPNANGDYRGDTYARFALRLMDALKIHRFVLAGNSLGGEVAWRTAAMAPQRVARLILIDASGYAFQPENPPVWLALARLPGISHLVGWLTPRWLVERSVRRAYGDPSKVTSELVDRYHELTLREGNRRALAQRLQQLEPGVHANRIATLRLPTLILWGGRDRLETPHHARRFQHDIPGSRLVIFDDLGHLPHEEGPSRTVQAAQAFLAAPE